MENHGSRGSFGQCSDRGGDDGGRGSARCVADRRLYCGVLPALGDDRRGGVWVQDGGQGRDRRAHAPAGQPVAQPLARPGQAGLDRADRATELLGRLLVGQPFQVTEQDRQPEPLGEPAQFLVDLAAQVSDASGSPSPTRRIAIAASALRRSRSRRRAASRRARAATRAATP